ncbi:hypothetical protein RJ640_022354 [Escallonia rubra]|uniref:CCHC-type domain-containing protein n=1 Tax=Escallonia rubra TaxID=112253 RepID=A0AA88QFL2_9ASTE|nr:hypothetical protein RJ640_022354 [Escallonia rubra]
MVERTLTTEEEHALTWDRFQEIFPDKYFPRNMKDDMIEEFLKLEQGKDETVKNYEARFSRLSRFATHVIDTEERRATQFKNGLKYGIRKFLTFVTLDTYGQKRRSEESSSKRKDVVQQLKRRNNNLAIKEVVQKTQKPTIACKTYGKNHTVVCHWESGACFNCQQQGHMIRDCPQPLKPQFIQVRGRQNRLPGTNQAATT